jgi:peroxiredoxin
MKNFKTFLYISAAALMVAGCGKKAVIDGTITGVQDASVVVKQLDINRFRTLDTLTVDKSGRFTYKIDVAEGQPEFIYLFYGETRVASLLLGRGDRVKVTSDTLGHYTVDGSEESLKLQKVDKAYSDFLVEMTNAAASGDQLAVNKLYINYYRDCVKYVMENGKSLTSVPVLFQQLGGGTPVFAQSTDALLFRAVTDSLKTVYPASAYTHALEVETVKREKALELGVQIQNAPRTGYIDIELPDLTGKKVKLSETEGKVVMVYFWSTAAADQKMFNIDKLLPIYKEFAPKGLGLYAVSLDVDKTAWATAVRSQNLPWTNVCDIRAAASPLRALYNVQTLPTVVFIIDGEVDAAPSVSDAASLRTYLASKLR